MNPSVMNKILKISFLFVCMVATLAVLFSCEFDKKDDPDHPLFVTYMISAANVEYSGPELLLTDINKWIESNSDFYDVEVNYTTGAPEEFAKTDAEAIARYEKFLTKFNTYLDELKQKLAKGAYDSPSQVKADFNVYVKRAQGQSRDIKSEHVDFMFHK